MLLPRLCLFVLLLMQVAPSGRAEPKGAAKNEAGLTGPPPNGPQGPAAAMFMHGVMVPKVDPSFFRGFQARAKAQQVGKKAIQMGATFVLEEPGFPPLDTYYATNGKGVFHVPAPLPPIIRKRSLGKGPLIPVSNYYPPHAYLPAYRSTYFYSPWMHDPFGLRPFNHYAKAEKQRKITRPFNTYLYPWRLPSFPNVGAAHAEQWGYPGYYPGVPAVRGFPGGGMPGVPHPAYPFLTPVSRTVNGVEGVYHPGPYEYDMTGGLLKFMDKPPSAFGTAVGHSSSGGESGGGSEGSAAASGSESSL